MVSIAPVAPLYAALREYVLDPARCLPEELCAYYWLYPHRCRVGTKHSAMRFFGGNGAIIYGHIFEFFPFGFWFVWNNDGDRSRQFCLRRLNDSSAFVSALSRLPLDLWPLQSMNLPEAPSNDCMWLVPDQNVSQANDREKQGKARRAE